jgi:5'-phosphate synthase pdxT subunit
MRIGVLALQGAFAEHVGVLDQLGVEAIAVRLPSQLKGLDGLIIPGGESTTILRLMHSFNLMKPLKKLAVKGFPIWGTCAGVVCLASKVSNSGTISSDIETLAAMDVSVKRNAFGRQIDSFEIEVDMAVLGDRPFPAVFIRAPIIESVLASVEILARLEDGTTVATKQGRLLATAFHPELTDDTRLHRYFIETICTE